MREKQAEAMGIYSNDKLSILANYGFDLIGAVQIEPDPDDSKKKEEYEPPTMQLCTKDLSDDSDNCYYSSTSPSPSQSSIVSCHSRASIPGVQKKLPVIRNQHGEFEFTKSNQLSSHIAKLSENMTLENAIEVEFLTSLAFKWLLPNDRIANMEIGYLSVSDIPIKALFVERFDREDINGVLKRKHFEEFNQLLGKQCTDKYNGAYSDMADFIRTTPGCSPHVDIKKLFSRVLACLLLNNTDAHLKNFAMFCQDGRLSFTPMYDMLATAFYPEFQLMALRVHKNASEDMKIYEITPKHVCLMGDEFNLTDEDILTAVDEIECNWKTAKAQIESFPINTLEEEQTQRLKSKLIDKIEKRWNDTFKGIKTYLSLRKKKCSN